MPDIVDADSRQDFARAFGDALNQFLEHRGIRQSDAAKLLGLENGKARLNTYCHDSRKGKRPKPNAEILYLACAKLPGFSFDYKGYRISAATLNGQGAKRSEKTTEQLTLNFDRQFNLTEQAGSVRVTVKRPPGRIELSVSLDATAS
jgi:hypothetical protein